MVTPYRPPFQSQFGYGTQYDDENCAATAGCIALGRHTLGKKFSNPPMMRRHTDDPNRQDGLSLSNIEYAWLHGWDEDLVNPIPYEPFAKFVSMVEAGRGAIIFGDCSYVRQGKRCPGRFPANHALYVNEIDGTRALTYDPADRGSSEGIRWISLDTLRNYADNWTKIPGWVNAAYTRITVGGGPEPSPEPSPLPAGCAGTILQTLRII